MRAVEVQTSRKHRQQVCFWSFSQFLSRRTSLGPWPRARTRSFLYMANTCKIVPCPGFPRRRCVASTEMSMVFGDDLPSTGNTDGIIVRAWMLRPIARTGGKRGRRVLFYVHLPENTVNTDVAAASPARVHVPLVPITEGRKGREVGGSGVSRCRGSSSVFRTGRRAAHDAHVCRCSRE